MTSKASLLDRIAELEEHFAHLEQQLTLPRELHLDTPSFPRLAKTVRPLEGPVELDPITGEEKIDEDPDSPTFGEPLIAYLTSGRVFDFVWVDADRNLGSDLKSITTPRATEPQGKCFSLDGYFPLDTVCAVHHQNGQWWAKAVGFDSYTCRLVSDIETTDLEVEVDGLQIVRGEMPTLGEVPIFDLETGDDTGETRQVLKVLNSMRWGGKAGQLGYLRYHQGDNRFHLWQLFCDVEGEVATETLMFI